MPQRNCNCYNDVLHQHKSNDHLPVGDTDFFDFVTGVLQGDTLAPFLFIICLDNVL